MHRELVDGLLPRLERHLDRSIQRYRAGGLTGKQLTDNFHRALERQFLRLTRQGVAEADAALVIHAVVLILGVPGLRAEAAETQLPVEIIEYRALQAAATDLEQNYQVNARRALRRIAALVAYYRE